MLKELIQKSIYVVAGAIIMLIIFVIGYFLLKDQTMTLESFADEVEMSQDISFSEEMTVEQPEESSSELIYVDIKGAVHYPNMYALPKGSRLFDLIEKAGGFLPDAHTQQVNLAQLLEDQMMLYIYRESDLIQSDIGEDSPIQPLVIVASDRGEDSNDNLININSASQAELETLPNIGPKKADAIIQYRTQNGSFSTIEEMMNVSGIGEKTFESLKDLIKVAP